MRPQGFWERLKSDAMAVAIVIVLVLVYAYVERGR